MKVNKAIPIQSAPVVDKYYEANCFTWTGVYCPRTVVNVSHVGGQISWSQEGGVSPADRVWAWRLYRLLVMLACPRGGNTWEGHGKRRGSGAFFCFVYTVVCPPLTCFNLCLSTAEMIFPEHFLAPSQTRFQEMVVRRNMFFISRRWRQRLSRGWCCLVLV